MKPTWSQAIETEMHFASIIQRQAEHGWLVDAGRIKELLVILDKDMSKLEAEVEPQLPSCKLGKTELNKATPPMKQFLKDGAPSSYSESFFDKVERSESGWIGYKELHGMTLHIPLPTDGLYDEDGKLIKRYPLIDTRPMLLKDNAHIKQYLVDHGWRPTWYNEDKDGNKTSPKVKKDGVLCPNLDKLENPIAKSVVKYFSMRHRKGMLEGFLRIIRPDGRIPSECDTVGTATFRVAHRKIANLPNSETYFGTEIRSCFIAPYGTALVSTDSDSCQMRMLAHYLIAVGESLDHPYIQAILYGTKEGNDDAHCIARDLAGLSSRSEGKTLNYGLLFGQGDRSLAEKLNVSFAKVKQIKATFFSNVPALPRLLRELKSIWERKGSFIGLDGRPVACDSEHKLLNYLLQSAESIYMKVVVCYIDSAIRRKEIDAEQVCFYHDEVTHEVKTPYIRDVVTIQEDSMGKAGRWLKINVPMTGTAQVGSSWAEVH